MKRPVVLKILMLIMLVAFFGACVPGDDENSAPVADSQTVSTLPDTAVAVTLTGSDSDGDTLTYSVTGNPSHGTLSGSAPDLTYTPDNGYSGSDSFTFTVSDGEETSSSATVSLTIAEDSSYSVTLTITAHSGNTLMAVANATVSEAASVNIEYSSAGTATFNSAESDSATDHTITVIGMRAETNYSMTAVATFSDGSVARSNSVDFTTGSLPETPPTVSVTTSTSNSAGGITFFGTGVGQSESKVYWGFDEAGEVVWYLHGDYTPASSPVIRVVEPGVLLIFLNNSIRTITTTGQTIADYSLGRYHHEALLLPNGNTLMLANETMDNSDGDTITGDIIIEKDASGTTLWEWSSFDHLDTTRFPGSLSMIEKNGALDWTHSNALFYIEDEDAILLSVRSQSWVVKIDRATGNILWIMGDSAGTDPAYQYNAKILGLTSGTWMANQHASMLTDAGEVLIYDNRNESGGATDMSRVAKFSIDGSAMTATQTWEAISPKYTSSLGDVDELENGNVMMCSGGPGSESLAYIVEVTSDSPAETVWSMSVNTNVYRAERMSWADFLKSSDPSTPDDGDDDDNDDNDDDTPALPYVVVDTAQTECYGTSGKNPVTCSSEGESLHGQDAHYSGPQPSYRDNGDGTVTDLNTGLIWQQVPPEGIHTWTEAKTYAGNLTLAGKSDWRLPSIKELYSLALFYGNSGASPTQIPYLDTDSFSYTFPSDVEGEDIRPIDGQYITSTEYLGITMGRDTSTFGFNFADGRIKSYPNGGTGPDKSSFIRCVRGNESYGQNDFVDNGDDTITDNATGLMWMKSDSGSTMKWSDALAYAENLEHAGYSDWRLPNTKELQSIVDYDKAPDSTDTSKIGPAIDSIFDLTLTESWFWTGTTLLDDGGGIYICFGQASAYNSSAGDFSINAHGAGAQRSDPKIGEPENYPEGHGPQKDEIRIYNYVRCVRNVQ